jgi:hypothetical protein
MNKHNEQPDGPGKGTRLPPWLVCFLAIALVGVHLGQAPEGAGQEKKKKADGKGEPRALLAVPLGVRPGATMRVTIRGLHLDTATEVRFPDGKATAKVVSKSKAAPPDKLPPQKVGDTQVVAEVTVPAGVSGDVLPFTVVTPAGQTKPHSLLLHGGLPAVAEKEPNDGFRDAQKITLPQAVDGVIGQPRDVDVFAFTGKAGQRVVFEVLAARYGSPLDSVLTLYGPGGSELASNDDSGDSLDSRLEATLPQDGVYHVSIVDAQDHGGPLHVYRLIGRAVK